MEAELSSRLQHIAQLTARKLIGLFHAFPHVGEEDIAQEALRVMLDTLPKWDRARGPSFLYLVARRAGTRLFEQTIRNAKRATAHVADVKEHCERRESLLEQAEAVREQFADYPEKRWPRRPGYPQTAYAASLALMARTDLSIRRMATLMREDRGIAEALGFMSGSPNYRTLFDAKKRMIGVGVVPRE